MIRRTSRWQAGFDSRRGVAALELALLLPLLIGILLGVWELGRMVEVQQLLTNACREGGRQASTGNKTAAQVKTDVVNYLTRNGIPGVTTANVTVENLTASSRAEPTNAEQLDRFRISVSIPVDSIRWILMPRISTTKTLDVSVDWYSMKDIPIAVSDVIPVQ